MDEKEMKKVVKQWILDMLRCNNFQWFVTVTFNKDSVTDRMDDNETRHKFKFWLKHLKEDFPETIYIAVAEHHKKGGLHFHVCMGNITAEQLKLVDSGKRVKKGYCKGDIIYNITRWGNGWSTATEIRDVKRCKWYLMKYMRKQSHDLSFFGKKRYWASKNVLRPTKEKYSVDANEQIRAKFEKELDVVYYDPEKQYTVLESQNLSDMM